MLCLRAASVAPLAHALAGHVSAEAGHRMLLDALWFSPLLDLYMRLGKAPARRRRF
jgi:nicotinate-nucleotide--dimethylbenzimidazole phosphoribosyltransferase